MGQRRRVLLMSQMLTEGGSERQLAVVARSLDRDRFDPIVGCFRTGGLRFDELLSAGVRVEVFPVSSFYNPPPVGTFRRLGRFLQQENIDLLHTFDVPTGISAIPIARLVRTPRVLSSQRGHRALAKGMLRHLLRISDTMVDGIVVNSGAVARELIEQDKVAASRIHLCQNALDTSAFYPPESRPESPIGIGAIGVFRQEKGHRVLIDAFARVHAAEPATRLEIIGGGPLHEDLQARVRELGLEHAAVIEPSTQAVRERLQRMHIFVLPSFSEAQSNALLEAMACGCCVLATNVGGNPEVLDDKHTGELFEAGDSAGLAARLLTAVRDRALRSSYGQAAASTVRDRFSLQASVNRMQSIYERIFES